MSEELDFDNEQELLIDQFKRLLAQNGSMKYAGGQGCLDITLKDGKYTCRHCAWMMLKSEFVTKSYVRAFDWLMRRYHVIDINGDIFSD